MLLWIQENLGSILVALFLIILILSVVIYMVKQKKKGKSSCSCGCSGCALQGDCKKAQNSGKK